MKILKIGARYNLPYKVFLAFVFMIPLSQIVSPRLLVVACVLSLFQGDLKNGLTKFLRNSWEILVYISVLLLGLLYSTDIEAGLRVIETNLCLLAVPFIFSSLNDGDSKKFLVELPLAFAAGLFVACIICLAHASIVYGGNYEIQSFFFYNLTDVIGFQPTYFAYYLIFVIAYCFYNFYYQNTQVSGHVYLIGCIFFFLVLLLTGGQTAFVSVLLVFSFFILKFLTEEKTASKKVSVALIFTMTLIMFLTAFLNDNEYRGLKQNDAWDRLVLWESAIEAAPKQLVLGVGTGDYKTALNEYYFSHDLEKFAVESYNSHNQFIQLLFSNGIAGVLAFVLMITRPLFLSTRVQDGVGILSVFPFLIYGVTEVFLGRYQGVVFFCFIHQFFVLKYYSTIKYELPKQKLNSLTSTAAGREQPAG